MNRNEFELKLKEAGFESGAEFAKKLKILRASVTEWHKYKYPEYVECVLNYTIQAPNFLFYRVEFFLLKKRLYRYSF